MTRSKVTLKDISGRIGFDKSTISRVLRNDQTLSIRKENIELIKKAARDMNYVPDTAGRSLRSSRSYSIGALVPSLQNQIHAQIVEGASEACRKRGYSLIIAHAAEAELQTETIHDMIKRNRVDGLLALTFRNEYPRLQPMQELAVPIMAVNWRAQGIESWVTVDERPGARLLTRHLIDLGHRRIAHLSGDVSRFNAKERLLGYQEALEEAGIAFDPDLVEPSGYSFKEGFEAMNALIDRKIGDFSAVFVVSILSAAGAISTLNKRGISVPGDISVAGFNDVMMASEMNPSISTVAFPLVEMGKAAANGLMDILDGNAKTLTHVVEGAKMIARDSSAPPGWKR